MAVQWLGLQTLTAEGLGSISQAMRCGQRKKKKARERKKKQFYSEVLLHSTGNYAQYPVINRNGKEYEKDYIYEKLNHFAVHQKPTQHGKSTILQ